VAHTPRRLPAGQRRRAPRVSSEGGLTLVEVVIAMMIMMVAVAALGVVITNAFAAVALSRQSQQATNLANAVLAQDEALAWPTIADGLDSSDPTFTGDAGAGENMVSGNGGYCFEGMPLVVNGTSASSCTGTSTSWYNLPSLGTCQSSVAPGASFPVTTSGGNSYLTHQDCVTLNGTNFEVGVYPTALSGVALTSQVQLTIEVSWGTATSEKGTTTHVSDSAVLTCGTTDGLSAVGCT
jgi:type II secretory pathway pseudopilin PulG